MVFILVFGWCFVSCYNNVFFLIDGRLDLFRLNYIYCLIKKKYIEKGVIKFIFCEKI